MNQQSSRYDSLGSLRVPSGVLFVCLFPFLAPSVDEDLGRDCPGFGEDLFVVVGPDHETIGFGELAVCGEVVFEKIVGVEVHDGLDG